jgi:hypothetical protein
MSDTDEKKYTRRRSIWNRADKLPVMRAAIQFYRNGDMTIVQIEKTFKISPRTFRRYIEWSKNPGSPFYMDEIPKQKSELIPRCADPFVQIPPDQISSCRFDKIDVNDVIDV